LSSDYYGQRPLFLRAEQPQPFTFPLPRSVLFLPNFCSFCYINSHLVILLAVEDAQDGQEQVDNVQVQADGGGNLLLDVVLAQDHLGINQDVAAKDEGGDAAVDELSGGAVGEEHGHKAKEDQGPEAAKQVGHPRGEVVLGLAGEEGEEDENAGGQDNCIKNDADFVKRHNNRDAVGLEEGEAAEEEQIGRVRFALPVGETEEAHRAEELHAS
jgi:hypothetical protein